MTFTVRIDRPEMSLEMDYDIESDGLMGELEMLLVHMEEGESMKLTVVKRSDPHDRPTQEASD